MKIAGPCEDLVGKPATIVPTRQGKTLKGGICWGTPTAAGIRFAVPLATSDLAAVLAERD